MGARAPVPIAGDANVLCCVVLIRRLTKEGETIPLCKYPLDLETETCRSDSNSFVFLVWPATVVHRINRSSPLWDISAEQMLSEQFEIIVILEGKQVIFYISDIRMCALLGSCSYCPKVYRIYKINANS